MTESEGKPDRASVWLEADDAARELNQSIRRALGRSSRWARPWIGENGRGWVRLPVSTARELSGLLADRTTRSDSH